MPNLEFRELQNYISTLTKPRVRLSGATTGGLASPSDNQICNREQTCCTEKKNGRNFMQVNKLHVLYPYSSKTGVIRARLNSVTAIGCYFTE